MNIFDRIKQLKLIEPDPNYSELSKRQILATTPAVFPFRKVTVGQIFMRMIEAGVAAGLVAIFLFLITGGVANSPLAPVPFASINPDALHAEAQEINIQIKLAKLAYQASSATGTVAESTSNVVSQTAMASIATTTVLDAVATSTATSTNPATSTLSVDQVLQALSR